MAKITIVLLLFLFVKLCSAQPDNARKESQVAGMSGRQKEGNVSGVGYAASMEPTEPGRVSLDVLFATNEDCRIYLNEEFKGMATRNEFLYLKLPPGNYRCTARSLHAGGEWKDSFSIASGRANEVFIDMLYAIDVEKERKATAIVQKQPAVAITATGKSKLSVQKVEERKVTDKGREASTVNAVMASLVQIKGGSFVMGNKRSPSADEAEHTVLLNNFLLSKYEVTQEQWEAVMGNNPSINKNCSDCPVENVSWEEVMVFIRKLNSLTNKKFRLPTEAEWEYAAKLGGKAEIDRAGGTAEYIKNTAWGFSNSQNRTHPVGEKQPNAAGLYDLLGNVSEWCWDWYGAFFYKEDDTEKNPEGPPLGKEKVIKGGNYKDYVGDRFRPSFRNKMNPKSKGSEVGFRLVLEQ